MTIELRAYQFRNNARSTLQAAITADDTQLRVEEGKGDSFPELTDGQIFSVILWNTSLTRYEVVYCTARNGDILTVERAKEGTASGAFSVGSIIVHNVTAGFFQQLLGAPPSTPVLTAEATGETEITLDWTAAVPVAGTTLDEYDIYRSDNGGSYSLLTTVDGSTLEYIDSAVNTGHTYRYYVVAIPSVGSSAQSNVATVALASPTRIMFVKADASASYTSGGGFVVGGDAASASAPVRATAYSPGLARWATCGTGPGKVTVSDDQGATWADKAHGIGQNFEKMVYAFGAFWMGSNNGSVFTSANAEAPWTARMTGSRGYGMWYSPAENRVAVCGDLNSATDTPTIQYADSLGTMLNGSTTGLSTGGSNPANTLYGIGRDDSTGLWWCINADGKIYSTSDIVAGTWTLRATIAAFTSQVAQFAFKSGVIMLTTQPSGGGYYISTDGGDTFTLQHAGIGFNDCRWSDFFAKFFLTGDDTWTSDDGTTLVTISLNTYTAIGEGAT